MLVSALLYHELIIPGTPPPKEKIGGDAVLGTNLSPLEALSKLPQRPIPDQTSATKLG